MATERVEILFRKGGEFSGCSESFFGLEYYKIKLQDCLAIAYNCYIDEMKDSIVCWREPRSYSPTSGYFYISCDKLMDFFNRLSKTPFNDKYYFSTTKLRNVLLEMATREHISASDLEKIMSITKHSIDSYDQDKQVLAGDKNYNECLDRMYYHMTQDEFDSQRKALNFLLKAIQRYDGNIFDIPRVQIDNVLKHATYDDCGMCTHKEFVQYICEYNVLEKISYINPGWLRKEDIENLSICIASLTSLTELCLDATWSSRYGEILFEWQVPLLGSAIAESKSLQKVRMTEQNLKEELGREFLSQIKAVKTLKFVNVYRSIPRSVADDSGCPFEIHAKSI